MMNVEQIREYINQWEAGDLTDNALQALIYVECTNESKQDAESQPFEDGHTIKSILDTFTQEQKEVVCYLIGGIIESVNDFDNAFKNMHSIKSLFDTLTQEQKELVYYLIGRAIREN